MWMRLLGWVDCLGWAAAKEVKRPSTDRRTGGSFHNLQESVEKQTVYKYINASLFTIVCQ